MGRIRKINTNRLLESQVWSKICNVAISFATFPSDKRAHSPHDHLPERFRTSRSLIKRTIYM